MVTRNRLRRFPSYSPHFVLKTLTCPYYPVSHGKEKTEGPGFESPPDHINPLQREMKLKKYYVVLAKCLREVYLNYTGT